MCGSSEQQSCTVLASTTTAWRSGTQISSAQLVSHSAVAYRRAVRVFSSNTQSSRLSWPSMDSRMFELSASDGSARAGSLHLSGQTLALPAMLLYSKRGSPLNLTPDVARPFGPGKHIDATQLCVPWQALVCTSLCPDRPQH